MEGRVGDDSDLEERLRRGDPRAFEDLVIAYQHRVFGVALRMLRNRSEAEEIAQEVFLRVHGAVEDFRGEAKLSTWLYAITSRLCLNPSPPASVAWRARATRRSSVSRPTSTRRRSSSGANWR